MLTLWVDLLGLLRTSEMFRRYFVLGGGFLFSQEVRCFEGGIGTRSLTAEEAAIGGLVLKPVSRREPGRGRGCRRDNGLSSPRQE